MGDLFSLLRSRVPANAKLIVDSCTDELPEYRATLVNPGDRARMLEFAVFIRTRTIELVTCDQPLTEDDLAVVASIGEERGRRGMPRAVLRQVLTMHATATLREIQEVCGPKDFNNAMHMLTWLGPQGAAAQRTYTMGFLRGQKSDLAELGRARQYAEMLLSGDTAALGYGEGIGIRVPDQYRVIVMRLPEMPTDPEDRTDDVLNHLWQLYRAPATWHGVTELVALLPAGHETAAVALARDVAEIMGRPCAVGGAIGPASALAETFALARRVSRVARTETVPDHVYTMADVLVEVGVVELPEIDRWLRQIADRLAASPNLVSTIDSYYRNDMNRSRTAAALSIHPRTLDYRLRRVHDITDIDPHAVQGVRILSTAVSRLLAGR